MNQTTTRDVGQERLRSRGMNKSIATINSASPRAGIRELKARNRDLGLVSSGLRIKLTTVGEILSTTGLARGP